MSSVVNQYDKVTIIAHSMGGLVASHMLTNTSARSKVIKLFTLGTPFLGSAAVHMLISAGDYSFVMGEGNILPNDYLDDLLKSAFQLVAINIPSIYELYPTEEYFSLSSQQNMGYLSITDHLNITTNYTTFNNTRTNLPNSLNHNYHGVFNMNLFDEAVANNDLLWNGNVHISSQVDSYYVCGTGQQTIKHIDVEMNILENYAYTTTNISKGDSLVLSYSASINDLYSSQTYYVSASHSEGLLNEPVITFIKRKISGNNALPDGFYDNEP